MDLIEKFKGMLSGQKDKPSIQFEDRGFEKYRKDKIPRKIFEKGKVIKCNDVSFNMRMAKNPDILGCHSLKTGGVQVFLPLVAKTSKTEYGMRRKIAKTIQHELIHREIGRAISKDLKKKLTKTDIDHAFFEERLIRELLHQPTMTVIDYAQRFQPQLPPEVIEAIKKGKIKVE